MTQTAAYVEQLQNAADTLAAAGAERISIIAALIDVAVRLAKDDDAAIQIERAAILFSTGLKELVHEISNRRDPKHAVFPDKIID